ncbi:hypothetical protein HC891_17210 [Candidatus Gracilibacteria bacterium]|nr:hypothetical protein [Candidatus Gracilibacteria bacterium]
MSQRSLFWPLSFVCIAALLVLMLFSATGGQQTAALPVQQGDTCSPGSPNYPACRQQTTQACSDPSNPGYPSCKQTQTAAAQQTGTVRAQTAGTVAATNTTQPSDTAAPAASTATRTNTATATGATTPTVGGVTPTLATPTASATAAVSVTVAATPTLLPGVEVLECIPGVPITISGSDAPPETELILTFDTRPVGGSFTSDASGLYRTQLVLGEEKAGDHAVAVQTRRSRAIVDEFVCRVPERTPTPTFSLIP